MHVFPFNYKYHYVKCDEEASQWTESRFGHDIVKLGGANHNPAFEDMVPNAVALVFFRVVGTTRERWEKFLTIDITNAFPC